MACEDRVAAELTPTADLVQDPIIHAFVEFIYTTWRLAWKDVSTSTKKAAEAVGNPIPATYGNVADPTPIAIMEMPWQDVWWMETGYAWTNHNAVCEVPSLWGGTSQEVKVAQAAMRGIKAPTVWRCGGLRCGGPEQKGQRGARTYLAESVSNGAVEWLLEGYNYAMTLSSQPAEEKNYARFVTSWRSAFLDRSRLADGAVIWSLPSVVWRNVGPLSHFAYPGSRSQNANLATNMHERDLAAVSRLLEGSHAAYEVAMMDHPAFVNNSGSLESVKKGGYDWVILPSTDAPR